MLTKIHKITINSGLVLRIQDQWPDWARLQTSCSASFSSSGCFNLTIQIFCMMAMASLKVVWNLRLLNRLGQESGLRKYLPTDCAMCNVNNVLLTAAWPLDSWEVFTSRNVVCSLATAAVCYPLSGPRTILAGTQWSDGSVVSTSSGVRENSRIKHRWNLVDDMCRYCRYPTVYPEDRPSNYVI